MKQKKSKYTVRSDGRIMMTRTIDGKRVSFYGQSDREVEQKYADYLKTPTQFSKSKVRTFAQCAEDWWEEKEPELSPNSVRNYKALYGFARDYFNATPVDEITPAEIVTYLRRLSAQGFSQKAITNRKSVIKSILDNALIHGEIIFNPCINLPVVKGKSKVPRLSATDADIRAIEAHRNDSDIARMFYFILWTGCRKGEAAALQEKHIDRKAKTAHICQTLVYSSPHLHQLKSPVKSAETVEITGFFVISLVQICSRLFTKSVVKLLSKLGIVTSYFYSLFVSAVLFIRLNISGIRKTFADDVCHHSRALHDEARYYLGSLFVTSECDNAAADKQSDSRPEFAGSKFASPINAHWLYLHCVCDRD